MPVNKLHTVYDEMEFPKYEYREFPMLVPYVNGQIMPTPYNEKNRPHPTVKVKNQEELDALRANEVRVIPAAPVGDVQRVETDDDLRKALITQAGQLGVTVDKRWSIERIDAAIQAKAKEAKA